jgi:phage recombination protein Bet
VSADIVPFDLDRERLDLIKRTYAKDTSDAEFDLFVGVCKRLRLDPMAGQIYCMPTFEGSGEGRKRTFKAVVSIDGYRSLAEETGEYEGQTKPEWYDSSSDRWVDVWYGDNAPVAARIGIRRKGFVEPLYRVARYDAYVQTTGKGEPNSMWRKMHAEQLLKCAEALALRAAFPRKLAGVYTSDEMGQAQNEDAPEPVKVTAAQALAKQANKPSPQPPAGKPKFRWKARQRFDGTYVDQAPAEVITDYILYLNEVLTDKSKRDVHPEVLELRTQCEGILRVQLLLEAAAKPKQVEDGLGRKIVEGLQGILDGALPDPTDANNQWGMEEDQAPAPE